MNTLDKEPEAGLRYNEGKLRWSLMDYKAMEPMILVLMYGAKKYTVEVDGKVIPGDNNWKKGLSLESLQDCMQRHLAAIMNGEEVDPESGLPHIGHLMCNAMMYSHFKQKEHG